MNEGVCVCVCVFYIAGRPTPGAAKTMISKQSPPKVTSKMMVLDCGAL